MKALTLAVLLLSLSINAFDCDQSYFIAKDYITSYDTNNDGKLHTFELLDVFEDIESSLEQHELKSTHKEYARSGFLWLVKNQKMPKSYNFLQIARLKNSFKKSVPYINANRFIIESSLRLIYACDK